MKDFIGSCLLGALLGCMFAYGVPAKAQTVQMTNTQGYNVGTVQINGNTAQFVNPQGVTTQTATIYPNQIAMPSGAAIGTSTGYTVPSVPMSPPSPRVMQ